MLQRLEKQILAIVRSDDEPEPETLLSNQLRQNILEDLLSRYKSNNTIQLLNLASFLDPRFKATCLTQASSEYSEEEADIFPVKNRLCKEYESLMEIATEKDATEGSVTERGNSIEITQPLENGPPPSPAKKKKTVTLESWLGRHNSISVTGSGGQVITANRTRLSIFKVLFQIFFIVLKNQFNTTLHEVKNRYTGINGIIFPVYRYRKFLISNIPNTNNKELGLPEQAANRRNQGKFVQQIESFKLSRTIVNYIKAS